MSGFHILEFTENGDEQRRRRVCSCHCRDVLATKNQRFFPKQDEAGISAPNIATTPKSDPVNYHLPSGKL